MWTFLALLKGTAAILCPTFQCQALTDGVCATLQGASQILVNDNKCSGQVECSCVLLYAWYWDLNDLSPGLQYNCTVPSAATALPTNIENLEWQCSTKRGKVKLVSGTHPKACTKDTDCEVDSPFVSSNGCKCSLMQTATTGFCQPLIDESVYDDYWDLCSEGDGTLHQESAVYWFLMQNYYVYYLSDLRCSSSFWEFSARDLMTSGSQTLAALLVPWFL